jgi:hemerythrin-like metal-binding protein
MGTEMRWTPELATGNSVVDAEHQQLIALINKLELVGNGPNGTGVEEALDELTDYVFVHFQMEEKLMRREGYPPKQLEAHLAQHRKLDETTQEWVEQYTNGTLTTVEPIVTFLYAWFWDHISIVDRAMAEFIRTRHPRRE